MQESNPSHNCSYPKPWDGPVGFPPIIKVKKLVEEAKLPEKTNENIGWDISCIADKRFHYNGYREKETRAKLFELFPGDSHIFRTGIALEIPSPYAMLLWDRSGMGAKHNIHRLAGVIDWSYRGEIMVCLTNLSQECYIIHEGDRIVQGIIQKEQLVSMVEVDELTPTERGEKGLGSSGK